ncbi:MAG: aminomethyl transferase family protein [Haloquadratum sp.]|jgi:aminomethyltransferase|nr:aminomethyl transferase family protein [Haloferacaceae archaeon]MDR9444852.1 aminomethyl transferase family protein [Haloquadratum sp.]
MTGGYHRDLGGQMIDTADAIGVVTDYGRPTRTAMAVRKGAGVIELRYGVIELRGADREAFVNNTVSVDVPQTDAAGTYGFLLDPQGKIIADMYILAGADRLLCLVHPQVTAQIVDQWQERVFIQDVEITDASDAYSVMEVHGPQATEKVASVLTGPGAPADPFDVVRGAIGEAGVVVMAGDGLLGEEMFMIVGAREAAEGLFDRLLTMGIGAIPFGMETYRTLAIEAGTPLFPDELAGAIPNTFDLAVGVDYAKGCFIGQEVVSKVANRGRPSRELVGLRARGRFPTAAIVDDGAEIGQVTATGQVTGGTDCVGLGIITRGRVQTGATVTVDAEEVSVVALPVIEGSHPSGRRPQPDLVASESE